MRVVLTGATGFLGRAVAAEIRRRRIAVDGVSRALGTDLRRPRALDGARRSDAVVHLAAIAHPRVCARRPRQAVATNVGGTLTVLEWMRRRDVSRLVFASTYAYGRPRYLPVDEQHPLAPTTVYAATKVAAETLAAAYGRLYGLRVAVLRPFNLYGPGQRPPHLVGTIAAGLARGRLVLDDPRPRRDFVYVDDAARAFADAVQFAPPGLLVVNLAVGRSRSVREMAELAVRLWGAPVRLRFRRARPRLDVPNVRGDASVARRTLGWAPRVTFEDGLRRTVEAARVRYQDGSRASWKG